MDPELKRELDQIRALEKDNHDMLRAIRRGAILGFFGKVIIWLIVLALPFYLYQQYLTPLLEKFSVTPGQLTTDFLNLPSSIDVQKLLNSLNVAK